MITSGGVWITITLSLVLIFQCGRSRICIKFLETKEIRFYEQTFCNPNFDISHLKLT